VGRGSTGRSPHLAGEAQSTATLWQPAQQAETIAMNRYGAAWSVFECISAQTATASLNQTNRCSIGGQRHGGDGCPGEG